MLDILSALVRQSHYCYSYCTGHSVTSRTSVVPGFSDVVLDEIPLPNAATVNAVVKPSSKTPTESLKHIDRTSPYDEGTVSSVQSALFVRSSPEEHSTNESLVLIEALRPPSQTMIIVHSDNLPNVIVFQNSEQQSSTTPITPSKKVLEQKQDQPGSQVNARPDLVVFHKVPSVQDMAQSLNLLEDLEELDNLMHKVEVLEPAQSSMPSDQPPPAPEAAVNEMKPYGDGLSGNRTYGNTRDEATILQPLTDPAMSTNNTGKIKHQTGLCFASQNVGFVTILLRETVYKQVIQYLLIFLLGTVKSVDIQKFH